MRRLSIELADISERESLLLATAKAAKGKRRRCDVQAFTDDLELNLNRLAKDINAERLPYGRYTVFKINDPKPRLIHAACFPDRVFHHALMNLVGSKLDSSMSHNSYACRVGKGVHSIAIQVQRNMRRYRYFCKTDIDSYFSSIDHARLEHVVATRLKGRSLLSQCQRIIGSFHTQPNKGLPIGSLTSQYFANLYLDGFDRFLEQHRLVRASLRYMDDVIWWCDSRVEARHVLAEVHDWLQTNRALAVKPTYQINHCANGTLYCGFQIGRQAIRPSRRRRRRYTQALQHWQDQFIASEISSLQLQAAYAAVGSIVAHSQCCQWRQAQIERLGNLEV